MHLILTYIKRSLPLAILICFASSCSSGSDERPAPTPLFQLLDSAQTGIHFTNDLSFDPEFNVYRYRNFYNGGGVAIGDINNDGLPDLYFTSNLTPNKLYLNKGDFKFEDITEQASVSGKRAWSTGVTMADVNGDGFLDIYVCNSGDISGDNKQNELFINNGDLTFTEAAEKYGLDDQGYATHASFFDFDKDGDLDVYLLNNSYKAIGSFNLQRNERHERDVLGGDKLLRNDGGVFVDITEEAGIYGSIIGFGLGVSVSDLNNDGWDDIYVSNDFFERDYLYLNNQDGTFREVLTEQIKSISHSSMGADLADINNDGLKEIFVTEMLPSEYARLKSVTTFENWNKYQLNVKNDYHHQFTRNTLQLNNGNGTFSEIGRYSGVEASDWSWGALFFDMDNDGHKDLFISNGIYKDLTDQDYLQYISNEAVIKSVVENNQVDFNKLIDIIPSNKVANHAYKNLGDLRFSRDWDSGLAAPSFSNGAAYGDLDNDGDLDLVVNNVNMPSFIYRNNSNLQNQNHYLKFILKGSLKNTFAIGAKIKITTATGSQYLEQQPTRGFQSSIDLRPHFGLASKEPVTVEVVWPSGKITRMTEVPIDQTLTLSEEDALPAPDSPAPLRQPVFTENHQTIRYKHQENRFIDFDRDRLLPHMLSTQGPKMAIGDVDRNGLEDIYIGGAKGSPGTLFLGQAQGFVAQVRNDFEKEAEFEDAGSHFFDADNDGDLDLYVCSGGVEFSQFSSYLKDRLYLNDGQGNFTLSDQSLPTQSGTHSTSTVISSDIDKDGDLDLFVGERSVPGQYGVPGSGFMLRNQGQGRFEDVTGTVAPELQNIGMISDAQFIDLDGDGYEDLIVVGEFMGVEIFLNQKGTFTRKMDNPLADLKGWWNVIHATDLNQDGKLDLVLGNHGENSRFKASPEHPINLIVKDFDRNGFSDPIMTFTAENGKRYPYNLRHTLIEQLKDLKKKFPDYASFKEASITEILSPQDLQDALVLEANTLSSVILINEGEFNFKMVRLPLEAQFAPIYAIESHDFDGDGDIDIVLGGNLYGVKPEVGRYDANYGIYLENLGNLNFKFHRDGQGLFLDGEVRDMQILERKLIVTKNNDSITTFKF